jgi:hypothetical protein
MNTTTTTTTTKVRWAVRLAIVATAIAACWFALAGCDERSELWNRPTARAEAYGLTDAVAVADPDAERVVLLTTDAERGVHTSYVPVQRGVRVVRPAPDGSKLFLTSEGDGEGRPPEGRAAQGAALEVVTRNAGAAVRYPLGEPLTGLALDPRGGWAVLYADAASTAFVRNPNELLLVDLGRGPATGASPNPLPHTLRSFGGRPQRFTFTDELQLPGGARRLLIVETEQDVAILDLRSPDAPEITIQLTTGTDTRRLRPAGVIWSDGDAADDDARIGIRLDGDPTMLLVRLVPGDDGDFRPELNITDLRGVPSDAAFVRTDGGALALAALVPSRSAAVLVDPTTGLTTDVTLPAAYKRLSLVTEAAGGGGTPGAPVDVALLWNGDGGGAAFWELGRTVGRPYRSVETVGITAGVTAVVDVTGAHPELKILGTTASTFFLLDLRSRTAAPFVTSQQVVSVTVAAGGDRAWAFVPGSRDLAVVGLVDRHPVEMQIDREISQLFEIAAAAPGTPTGTRSLVAWQAQGSGGITVYDARATSDIDDRRNYSAILTGGL